MRWGEVRSLLSKKSRARRSRPRQLRLALASNWESIVRVEAATDSVARQAGLDERERFQLLLAVREATINAAQHGNQWVADKQIFARIEQTDNRFSIIIGDQGEGFDPGRVADPRLGENLLLPRGRGILLMRDAMDEVRFQRSPLGWEVAMGKDLRAI